jgi:4-amino-4-deoxy-L-arabinose transferase-like glycosyltransferase
MLASQVTSDQIKKRVLWLIMIATAIRLLLASQLELANDEVYYWTYALYPDLSHFDHPPMVGFLAQLSTLNLFFKDDFFLRLGSILLAAGSTWIIYLIGTKVKNEVAGLYAAFLFTSSIYCSIISGFSLIPDSPQVFFWLLSLNFSLSVLPAVEIKNEHRFKMILIGVCAGLAMLSKYHSVFIWFGILLYVLFKNRKWLIDYSLYLSGIISLIIFSPVIIWNIQHDFISFTFHGDRVTPAFSLRPDYFFTELGGQIAYNNPLNVILIVIAITALIKGGKFLSKPQQWILLFNGIPLWFLFTGFSLFRSTLPHWSGPAFIPFIVIAAVYWTDRMNSGPNQTILHPLRIVLPSYFLSFLLVVTMYVVNYAPISLGKQSPIQNFGEYDFTQDMNGWDQVRKAFTTIAAREEKNGKMPANSSIVSDKWFPGTHLDFYVAQPNHRDLFLIGSLNEIHKYAWINEERGGLRQGENYYCIVLSNNYKDPNEAFGNYFDKIEPIDTVAITKGSALMRYAFFYRLKNYKGNFEMPIK